MDTEKKKINWTSIIICSSLLLMMLLLCYLTYTFQTKWIEQREATDAESKQKLLYKISLDSARAEVATLSTYKNLTEAMSVRDIALKALYKVGDIAYTKNDSSRVIITDRIIGGGMYNYYIKYKILYSDSRTDEVVPELIYKKK